MPRWLFWTMMALIVVWLVYDLWLRPNTPPSGKAMKDAARDPAERRRVSRLFRKRTALSLPDNIDDAYIRDLVERLVDDEDEDMVFPDRQLGMLGERAKPFLLEALSEPRFLHAVNPEQLFCKRPFEKVVSCLADIGAIELIPHLMPLVGHIDDNERKVAAQYLATLGSDDCIEPLMKLLDDDEPFVRSRVHMGISRAIKSGRATERFRLSMFDALISRIDRVVDSGVYDVFDSLVNIDRDRTLSTLASDHCLRRDHPNFRHILGTLTENGIAVEEELLWLIHSDKEPDPEDNDGVLLQGQILEALAIHGGERVGGVIRQAVESENKRLYSHAITAWIILHKVNSVEDHILEKLEKSGERSLNELQQAYMVLLSLDGQVNNGGYSQYFFNSSGNDYRHTIRVCLEIGAVCTVDQLRRAGKVFGWFGPSRWRNLRIWQYGRLSDEAEKILDDLASEFYNDKDRFRFRMAQFLIDNREALLSE